MFWGLPGVLPAQDYWAVRGNVRDSIEQALEHCLVYLTPDSSTQFIDFTYTDEKGDFQLKVPKTYQGVQLHTRSMGYAPFSTTLKQEGNKPTQIILRQKGVPIPTVELSGERPPVIERKDTLIYDADQFADSTEFNVEDLLKKIPGIEINADGSIKVNGKSIKKVLV